MSKVTNSLRTLVLGAALMQALSATAGAQQASPPPLPDGVFAAEKDIKLATAGTYALDPEHTAVVARVSHLGYSYSQFRFDKVEGSLSWDPANVAQAKLSITVQINAIATPVAGFGAEIAGDKFLNAAAFPTATFVSSTFRQTDAMRGKVDGQFTLMGKTKPMTFDVTLVGAGKGFMGLPRMGVQARATINPQDHGLPPFFVDPIEIVVDAEFGKTK